MIPPLDVTEVLLIGLLTASLHRIVSYYAKRNKDHQRATNAAISEPNVGVGQGSSHQVSQGQTIRDELSQVQSSEHGSDKRDQELLLRDHQERDANHSRLLFCVSKGQGIFQDE